MNHKSNLYEIQKLRVFQVARSFEINFVQIGCLVFEIMKFHDFYILIHNLWTKNPITMKFNRVLWDNEIFHLQLISWKSVQPSLRKASENKNLHIHTHIHTENAQLVELSRVIYAIWPFGALLYFRFCKWLLYLSRRKAKPKLIHLAVRLSLSHSNLLK